MLKPSRRRVQKITAPIAQTLAVGASILQLMACAGCSSEPKILKELPFARSAQKLSVDRKFRETFPGPITDIALAEKSGRVLASSIPDPESGGKHLLTLVDQEGDRIFQVPMKVPVKSLDLSADGTWMMVQHHEGMILALDEKGNTLWEKTASCRPVILDAAKEVLCYHDDDTKPALAFEVFDYQGNLVAKHPTKADVLALKVSKDQNWIAIAFVGGRAAVLNAKYKVVREFRAVGEILDVAVSDGESPRIALLSMEKKQGQALAVFDLDGKERGSAKPSFHVEQVELLPSGRLAAVYGNSPKGQFVAMYTTHDLALNWQKQETHYADYSLSVQVGEDRLLMGFEEMNEKSRSSRLISLDLEGKLLADLPLETAEGAYLYAYAPSASSSLIAVATDDKVLQLYELK